MPTSESQLEEKLIEKLTDLKYEYRADIRDRAALEQNFRSKFEALNRVHLTDGEFQRLLEEIITPDVFAAARTLRERNSFTRDDGTPLNYTLVNIKDWCKNSFELVNQLSINTDNSHHRYDVILLINGVPASPGHRLIPHSSISDMHSDPKGKASRESQLSPIPVSPVSDSPE
jgi:type I restriction enzyme R subunit